MGTLKWLELNKPLENPLEVKPHESSPKIRASHRWCQKATPIPTRNRRPPRDPTIPKIHRIARPKASIPAIGPRNCPGFQNRSPIPELCYHGSSRSLRSLLGRPLRRHQLVRHPRQEGHHYAKRYPIGSTNPRRTSLRNSPSLNKTQK